MCRCFWSTGARDKLIPIAQGHRIFERLPVEKRRWREIPDGYHYNVLAAGGDDLYEAMIHFFIECCERGGGKPKEVKRVFD